MLAAPEKPESPFIGDEEVLAYYEAMFNESGNGQGGMFDYWRDVSYGQLSVSGTVVTGRG